VEGRYPGPSHCEEAEGRRGNLTPMMCSAVEGFIRRVY
jgi:hypothetical protein